jgi:hypothetical protein
LLVKKDTDLSELQFLSPAMVERLQSAHIRSLRQLYHRLSTDRSALESFLALPREAFAALNASVDEAVQRSFPADRLPMVPLPHHPSGVAVERLRRDRPKYYADEDVYTPRKRG